MAEPISSTRNDDEPGSRLWRLKTASWLDVRPFEWPKLTEPERVTMARTARQKLDSLHIPETDPAWKHVAYRSTSSNIPASSGSSSLAGSTSRTPVSSADGAKLSTSQVEVPRRGVSSKEAKEKKAKPKADSKATIQMKDESVKATMKTSGIHHRVSPKPVVPSRKTPGSGFRMGKSTSQDVQSNTTPESLGHVVLPNTKQVDVHSTRDKASASLHGKSAHHISQPVSPDRKAVSTTQPQRIRKMREDASGGGTDSEKEKHAEHARALRREKARTREHGVLESGYPEDEDTSTLKRKKVIRDGNDYEAAISRPASQKKRKLENGLALTLSTRDEARGTLPKKPELARPKTRRDLSPSPQQMPLPKIRKDISKTSLPHQAGNPPAHTSTPPSHHQPRKRDDPKLPHKSRRRSPIYTSSEDERSGRSPRRAVSIGPLPTPPTTTHHASPALPAAHLHSRSHSHTRSLPTGHANLRARYSTSYLEYLKKFHELVAQKGKIDSMLKGSDVVSAGSITDSDGDVELMDSEALTRLSSEYKVLEEELETIRNIFSSQ